MDWRNSSRALRALMCLGAAVLPGVAFAADSAVVLMYHRFGETKYPSTNVTIEQFEAHLAELKSGGYTVVPVPEILASLRSGKPLPERAVGITVDDAYLSVFEHAWPRFRDAGLPFTLFIATDPVDRASAGRKAGYMNWDQVREMKAGGVTIGSQTASHLHMASSSEAKNRGDLGRSNARFAKELGEMPTLFAYPYGEAGLDVARIVGEQGFTAAFGQHSGAIGPDHDFFFLPRFALNENYGSLDRFRLVTGTLPLSVSDETPADPLIGDNNPPAIGFTVAAGHKRLGQMSCFLSPEKVRIERLGDFRFEIRIDNPLPKGRTRLNCTLPAGKGRWHWYGRQFFFPG
ncbi:MAG: polysaccharide deacetylase family protein [Rhodospirillales bacterium]|jgi:poly-beta-1,6-N-acetyl-D-glucosamine N-deacetylase|nr:polysaccharide deacetylase family protein [Rhodospirillales bacterium]